MRAWLPEGHMAMLVSDVVDAMDLSSLYAACETGDDRGRAGYHPAMMTKLLVYGYCTGVTSSRRIERATHQDVAFRVLSGDQQPDHDCIASFRRRHIGILGELFVQVLELCRKAGLVKLGHQALDGTKMGAAASKHKAMSYERMQEAEAKLRAEVKALLEQAERVDADEDARHGKGKRGDQLPQELQRRESRLKKIQEAKAALEAEATAKAQAQAAEARAKLEERARKEKETGKKPGGKPPSAPNVEEAKPEPKAQRNFTDPDSRIMPDGANKGAFTQAYNAQIAVDAEAQIIVAAEVTQQANDKQQLEPMAKAIVASMGQLAAVTSADAGYFSEAAIRQVEAMGTELLVPPDRQKHGTSALESAAAGEASFSERMREKLRTAAAHAFYRMRKAIVEPVFGQIKGARGLRRFALHGLPSVRAEWRFIAMTHNLLKLLRLARPSPALARA
jgi:transposase